MVATDERTYALRSCAGTVEVAADRLVIQGTAHAGGRDRRPVVIERSDPSTYRLRFGLFGGTLERITAAGYRSLVIRTRRPRPLWEDLRSLGWPVAAAGPRRPR